MTDQRTVTGIHAMSRGVRAILTISRLLIERDSSIHITIDTISSIYIVEGLSIVCAKPEVMDILRQPIDVVILCTVSSDIPHPKRPYSHPPSP